MIERLTCKPRDPRIIGCEPHPIFRDSFQVQIPKHEGWSADWPIFRVHRWIGSRVLSELLVIAQHKVS